MILDLPEEKEKLLNIALNDPSGEFDKPRLKEILLELDALGADLTLTGLPDLEALLLPPDPPEIKEWDLSETYEPFWIVIRGPLASLPKIKQGLAAVDLDSCQVEASA